MISKIIKKFVGVTIVIMLIIIVYFSYYRFIYRTTFEEYFQQKGYELEVFEVSEVDIIYTNLIEPKDNARLIDEEQIKNLITQLKNLTLRRDRYYEITYNIFGSAGYDRIDVPNTSQHISFRLNNGEEESYFNVFISFGRNIQIVEVNSKNGVRKLNAYNIVGNFYELKIQ